MDEYKLLIEGESFILSPATIADLDIVHVGGSYHTLIAGTSYTVEHLDTDGRIMTLRINGKIYEIDIRDQVDLLVEKLGLDTVTEDILTEVKAPMPGILLEMLVETGQAIATGDPLFILEAMKMENVIKATGSGVIKTILQQNGDTVDKNQIILELE